MKTKTFYELVSASELPPKIKGRERTEFYFILARNIRIFAEYNYKEDSWVSLDNKFYKSEITHWLRPIELPVVSRDELIEIIYNHNGITTFRDVKAVAEALIEKGIVNIEK